jgi:hypothetical protein
MPKAHFTAKSVMRWSSLLQHQQSSESFSFEGKDHTLQNDMYSYIMYMYNM